MNDYLEDFPTTNVFRPIEVVQLPNYESQIPLGIEFVHYTDIIKFCAAPSYLSRDQTERLRYFSHEMDSLCDTEEGRTALMYYQNQLIPRDGFLPRFRGSLYIAYNQFDYSQIVGIGNISDFLNEDVPLVDRPASEMGYLVFPEFQRKNIGTTIATSCLLNGFNTWGYKSAFFRVLNFNDSSQRVLRRLSEHGNSIGIQGNEFPADSIVRRSVRGILPAEKLYKFSRL